MKTFDQVGLPVGDSHWIMRAWAFVVMGAVLLAGGCDDPVANEPTGAGGGGAGGGSMAPKRIFVSARDATLGTAQPAIDVVSNRVDGTIIEHLLTDTAGLADLEVEIGGTVSLIWPRGPRHSYDLIRTFQITPDVQRIGLPGPIAAPPEPFELELRLDPVPGATAYYAFVQCYPSPYELWAIDAPASGDAVIVLTAKNVRGCAGSDSYSVFASAVVGSGAVTLAYDYVVDTPRPIGSLAVHSLAMDKAERDGMTVSLTEPTGVTSFAAHARRGQPGLIAPIFTQIDPEMTSHTLDVARLPMPVEFAAVARRPCEVGLWTGELADPQDLVLNPNRLAKVSRTAEGFTLAAEGERGVLLWLQAGSLDVVWDYYLPLPEPGAAVPLPARPQLPAELEELYGVGFEQPSAGTIDFADTSSYVEALQAEPFAGKTGIETRRVRACGQ